MLRLLPCRLFSFLVFGVALLAGGALLAQPTANFTANVTQGCSPLVVQFTNTTTGGNSSTTWSWNFNNGSPLSVLQNPSTTFTVPGTYTITLTANGPGGSNTKTVTNYITVHPSPTVTFAANDTDGCPPHTVAFSSTTTLNAPGSGTYLWNFGTGQNSTTTNPTYTYTNPGSYPVTLQVTNSYGCSASLTKLGYITVFQPPIASFSASTVTVCNPPGTTTFTPSVNGVGPFSYVWNFGDGSPTSTLSNPTHTYNSVGGYTVTLIVTDSRGCKDTAVNLNYINVGSLNASFTANPTSVCEDAPVVFTNTSTPGPTTATWNFGNNQTASGQSASVIYTTPGTYTVTMIAKQGQCFDTVQQTFVVHPKPIISFTASPVDPCPLPATVQFTNTTVGGNTYLWNFGDGIGTSTATNPSYTYTVYPNNYNPPSVLIPWDTVTLIAISQFGCTDTFDTVGVVKTRNLYANASNFPSAGCAPFTTTFSTGTPLYTQPTPGGPYPFPITSWLWNFGDGSPTSSSPSISHTYINPGTYTATLTYTTSNGCLKTDTLTVRVGTPSVPSFTVSPNVACVNAPVTFISTSTSVTTNTTYSWNFGDGGTGGGLSTTYTYNEPGTYTVILTVENNGCLRRDTLVNIVTINPSNADFAIDWDCDTPTLVRFVNQSVGATSYTWTFGDGTSTSSTVSPTHIYPALGNYTVKLTTSNATFGCKDSLEVQINLIKPVLNWVTDDTAICQKDSVTFTPTTPDSLVAMWTWHTGVTPPTMWYTDTLPPKHGQRYFNAGRYTVKLAILDHHGCPDTLIKTNHILVADPIMGFKADTLGCTPFPVTLLDTSGNTPGAFGVTRAWTITGPVPAITSISSTVNTAANIMTLTQAGVYTVKLKVTDNVGCTDSLTKLNYVEARHPEAGFFANDTSACLGQTVLFGNNSYGVGPLTFSWNFGDGGTSTQATPSHVYTTVGSYTVRLIVTDTLGCKDTLIRAPYISVTKPDASFTISDTMAVCPPLVTTVTSTSIGAVGYAWTFGNNASAFLPVASNLYANPGIYTIRLIVSDIQGCTDTASRTVRVLGYAGAFSYGPLTGCKPLTVNFTSNITNVPSITWDFADGVTQLGAGLTASHTYVTPGAYVPKLILSDGTLCQASSIGLDTIKVDGTFPGFTAGPACAKNFINFTDTSKSAFSPIQSVQWIFHNNQTGSGQYANAYYAAAGTYPVTIIATNTAGCKDTAVRNITVNALPPVATGRDTTFCIGSSAQLNATGAATYVWTPAAGLSSTTIANPTASPTVATSYIVTGTDANGCKASDTIRVGLQFKTTSAVARPDSACQGIPIQLNASGAERYEWVPATGLNNAGIAAPLATPEQTTTYLVIASESTCIPDTNRVTVVVWPKPQVSAGPDVEIVAGKSTQLVASGPYIDDFLWTPATALTCTACANPQASPLKTTEYIVQVLNDYGCRDTDAVVVRVLCDKSQLFIPNSFSPNNDGQNDRFFPHGTGLDHILSFRVFNRWGEVVFERATPFQPNDEQMGWDGTFRGVAQSPDVYVYMLEAECEGGEPLMVKGDVTLMR